MTNWCDSLGYPRTTVGDYPYRDVLITEVYVRRHYPDAEFVDIDLLTHRLLWRSRTSGVRKAHETRLGEFWNPRILREPPPDPLNTTAAEEYFFERALEDAEELLRRRGSRNKAPRPTTKDEGDQAAFGAKHQVPEPVKLPALPALPELPKLEDYF